MAAAAGFLFLAGAAGAKERLSGPVAAEVVRVIDGDSLEVRALVWLRLEIRISVRIRGIDAPEMRGACPQEKALAAAARDRLAELAGLAIRIANIAEDKYGGRVVADATTADGIDLAAAMIASRLARPYDGAARGSWCPAG